MGDKKIDGITYSGIGGAAVMKEVPFKAGDKLTQEDWLKNQFLEVLFIGEHVSFVRNESGGETLWSNRDLSVYKYYTAPKKTVKMLPAFFELVEGETAVSQRLFISEEKARFQFNDKFIKWPAIPNPDGSYDVEIE